MFVDGPNAMQAAPKDDLLYHEAFENPQKSGYLQALLRHPRMALAAGNGREGNGLRCTYQGFERGSERMVAALHLPREVDEATLVYDVFFEEDFQWTHGGKLHGLGPIEPVTGGGTMDPAGWSARIMFKEDGLLRTYLYTQDKTTKWGVGRNSAEPVLQKGRWHRIAIHVRVNEPDLANGFAHVYLDGKRVITHDEVRFRATAGKGTGIETFLFSTFHGGNKPRWAPRHADGSYARCHARFDNITIYPGAWTPTP